MHFFRAILTIATTCVLANAQSYTSCNPLTATCPADTALGKSISVDFRKGAVDSFQASGTPTYGSDGVTFTVAKSGDAPQLASLFYIMFGKVSITLKAAPGTGIVSTLVLQSDDLDEIDLEWLGGDDTQVQTNYFGKGQTTDYNRGAFNPAPNNHDQFVTYTIEWTAQQIVWSVGGSVVRVLTPATADANQYPQTPMQIKFGCWAGGDPSNAAGTIQWAGGQTNYAAGPFSMTVQSIDISDYSTGTQYKYTGTSGNWQDITAVGGTINGNAGGAASTVAVAVAPSVTSASPSVPAGIGQSSNSNSNSMTGWPWVLSSTTLTTSASPTSSIAGIPSGWTVSSSGKIVPASTAAPSSSPTLSSSVPPSPLPSSPPILGSGLEVITAFDDRGFLTTETVVAGWETLPKSYDDQGFLITPTQAPDPPSSTSSTTLAVQTISSGLDKNTIVSHAAANDAVQKSNSLTAWCVIIAALVIQAL